MPKWKAILEKKKRKIFQINKIIGYHNPTLFMAFWKKSHKNFDFNTIMNFTCLLTQSMDPEQINEPKKFCSHDSKNAKRWSYNNKKHSFDALILFFSLFCFFRLSPSCNGHQQVVIEIQASQSYSYTKWYEMITFRMKREKKNNLKQNKTKRMNEKLSIYAKYYKNPLL